MPEWHLAQHVVLIQYLVEPLAALCPALGKAELLTRSRTLFSAVHGIVAFSLERRFLGLAQTDVEAELLNFVDTFVAGLKSQM